MMSSYKPSKRGEGNKSVYILLLGTMASAYFGLVLATSSVDGTDTKRTLQALLPSMYFLTDPPEESVDTSMNETIRLFRLSDHGSQDNSKFEEAKVNCSSGQSDCLTEQKARSSSSKDKTRGFQLLFRAKHKGNKFAYDTARTDEPQDRMNPQFDKIQYVWSNMAPLTLSSKLNQRYQNHTGRSELSYARTAAPPISNYTFKRSLPLLTSFSHHPRSRGGSSANRPNGSMSPKSVVQRTTLKPTSSVDSHNFYLVLGSAHSPVSGQSSAAESIGLAETPPGNQSSQMTLDKTSPSAPVQGDDLSKQAAVSVAFKSQAEAISEAETLTRSRKTTPTPVAQSGTSLAESSRSGGQASTSQAPLVVKSAIGTLDGRAISPTIIVGDDPSSDGGGLQLKRKGDILVRMQSDKRGPLVRHPSSSKQGGAQVNPNAHLVTASTWLEAQRERAPTTSPAPPIVESTVSHISDGQRPKHGHQFQHSASESHHYNYDLEPIRSTSSPLPVPDNSGANSNGSPNDTDSESASGKVIVIRGRPQAAPIELPPTRGNLATPAPALVRLISKQRLKYDDSVRSPALTVIDNDAVRLPNNATIVHNNKLLVTSKPGRPQRKQFTSTTQFPYYNIVAGITPPYAAQVAAVRPPQPPAEGSSYGLIRPQSEPTLASAAGGSSSTFGAPNIRFPAPGPPLTHFTEHIIPEKLNISVPNSASLVGPNRVPDRLTVHTDEMLSLPANTLVQSEATMVSMRPANSSASVFTGPDGLVRLTTTRRPLSQGSTTKKVVIFSSNTTVVTDSADQLINHIVGAHNHHERPHSAAQNRPSKRHKILDFLANFMSNSATSLLAFFTLLKTIALALLVMFVPPIALTSAIVHSVVG